VEALWLKAPEEVIAALREEGLVRDGGDERPPFRDRPDLEVTASGVTLQRRAVQLWELPDLADRLARSILSWAEPLDGADGAWRLSLTFADGSRPGRFPRQQLVVARPVERFLGRRLAARRARAVVVDQVRAMGPRRLVWGTEAGIVSFIEGRPISIREPRRRSSSQGGALTHPPLMATRSEIVHQIREGRGRYLVDLEYPDGGQRARGMLLGPVVVSKSRCRSR